MIERSVPIELAGTKFRLWLDFSSLRRLGCRNLTDTILKLLAMRDRDDAGRPVDFNFEAIEDVLWASIYNAEPGKDGRTLNHTGLSKDAVRGLIDAEMEASGEFQPRVLARIFAALDEAAAQARIIDPAMLGSEKSAAQEVGEAAPDPTPANLSDASSTPLAASV